MYAKNQKVPRAAPAPRTGTHHQIREGMQLENSQSSRLILPGVFASGHGSTVGGGAYVAVSVDSVCMRAIRSLQNEIELYSRRNPGLRGVFDWLYSLCAIWRVGVFLSRALEGGRNKGQDHSRDDAGHGHGASCTAIGARAVG